MEKEDVELLKERIESIGNLFRYKQSPQTDAEIANMNKWMFAVSTGALVLIISNFDKFVIYGMMPSKLLFLSSLIFLFFASTLFGLFQLGIFFKMTSSNYAKERVLNIPQRVTLNFGKKNPEELSEMIESTLEQSFTIFFTGHNFFHKSFKWLFFPAFISFGIGILLITGYATLFFIQYL